MNFYSVILCLVLSTFGNDTKQFVEFKEVDVVAITKHDYVTITLPFEVLKGYHIQSNVDISSGLIPTEITFEENSNYTIEHQEFSLVNNETIVLDGVEQMVITNGFEITVTLKRIRDTSNARLKGELYYQACTDRQCLFPRALNFQIQL